MEGRALDADVTEWGSPSSFACPECHGVLLKLKEGNHFRFRCQTGHAYSLEALMAKSDEKWEADLWNANRSLEEALMVTQTLADQAAAHQHRDAETLRKKTVSFKAIRIQYKRKADSKTASAK